MTLSIGPVMLDIAGTQLTDEEATLLASPAVAGVILFSRNIDDAFQVRELCASIRQVNPALLIAIDQEGGRVQRLVTGVTRLPPMAGFGQLAQREGQTVAVSVARDTGWLLGMEMAAVGVDFSFAPVLDVDSDRCPAIGNRAFSDDPDMVAALAGAFIEGLREAGMASVGKHFPGHGHVALDSHLTLPVDDRSFKEIESIDLVPFRHLAPHLTAIMPAHVCYPAFDDRPAGFSPSWLGLLRESLGFKGVVISDDLSMKGAHGAGTPLARAEMALAAGCDMVLICNDPDGARQAVAGFEGRELGGRGLSRLRFGRARPSLEALEALGRWRKIHARLAAMCELAERQH
ncbi:beta-N-acetylhexosaminidase [Larsenimonas rhizosphaerae]|uniref:beta-N-acetylhexosaminidase n=1 Tax=Larsenimonas rhizosphaerae TaxID=2944682 RepID=UPI002034565F|nr:beta-N-acetylhexosaminidase [Larsenimonas rhizosphaerae]MCM2131000.1 beta-N-acetylhexosaminidase [Larsenimonas rhizosphaerae]